MQKLCKHKIPVWVIEDLRERQFSDWLFIHPLLALSDQPQFPDHDQNHDDDKNDDQSYDDVNNNDDDDDDENAT